MTSISSQLRPGLILLAAFTLLLGGLYPLLFSGMVGHGLALAIDDRTVRDSGGHVLATSLSGPDEQRPQYAWGPIRIPSDCESAPTQPMCQQAIVTRLAELGPQQSVPPDILRFESPGERPQISVAAATWQVPRIASARHIPRARVDAAIEASTHNSIYNTTKGLYVDVLELNLRLDGKIQ